MNFVIFRFDDADSVPFYLQPFKVEKNNMTYIGKLATFLEPPTPHFLNKLKMRRSGGKFLCITVLL